MAKTVDQYFDDLRDTRVWRSIFRSGAGSSTLKRSLEERGLVVQTLLMFSEDIARAILNVAEEREVTVIALGLTGKNVFARLLAGNVPVELIKNTKIPVLLLPPDWNGTI